jgi:hypothetical protein
VDRAAREQERKEQARLDISFQEYLERHYLPEIRHANKEESVQKTISHVSHWIGPVVGTMPIRIISPSHCKEIKRRLLDGGRSPRTSNTCLPALRLSGG